MLDTLDNRYIIARRNVRIIRDADGNIIDHELYYNGIVRKLSGHQRGYAVTKDPSNLLICYFNSKWKAEDYIENNHLWHFKIFYKNKPLQAYVAVQKKDVTIENYITYKRFKKNIQKEVLRVNENKQQLTTSILESNKNYIKEMVFLKDKNTGLYISINGSEINLTDKENSTYFEDNVQSNAILNRINSLSYISKYHDMNLIQVDNNDQPIKKVMKQPVKFEKDKSLSGDIFDDLYDIRKEENRKLEEATDFFFKSLFDYKNNENNNTEKQERIVTNNTPKRHIKVPANRQTIITRNKESNQKKKNVNKIAIKKLSLVERMNYAYSQKDKNGCYKGDNLLNRKRDARGNLIEYTSGYAHKYINGVKIY